MIFLFTFINIVTNWAEKERRHFLRTFMDSQKLFKGSFRVNLNNKKMIRETYVTKSCGEKKWQIVQSVNLLCELCSRRCIMHSHDLSRWSDVPSTLSWNFFGGKWIKKRSNFEDSFEYALCALKICSNLFSNYSGQKILESFNFRGKNKFWYLQGWIIRLISCLNKVIFFIFRFPKCWQFQCVCLI